MPSDRDIARQMIAIRDKLIEQGVDIDEDAMRVLRDNLWEFYTDEDTDGK